jgi:hypothetical protein
LMSLKVSDQQESQFLEEGDYTCTFETCMFDYNGNVVVPVPALHVTMTDSEGKDHEQYYSAGKPEKVVPTEDGAGFDIENDAGLSQNSNAAQFLKSLVDSGLDEDEFLSDNNVKKMDGINVHIAARPSASSGFGDKKDKTVFLVTKINSMPGEKPKAKAKATPAKPGAKPVAAPAKPASGAKGLESALVEIISGLLAEADENTIAKSALSALVFNKVKVDPKLKPSLRDLTKLANDEEFLGNEDRPWVYADEQLVGQG